MAFRFDCTAEWHSGLVVLHYGGIFSKVLHYDGVVLAVLLYGGALSVVLQYGPTFWQYCSMAVLQ